MKPFFLPRIRIFFFPLSLYRNYLPSSRTKKIPFFHFICTCILRMYIRGGERKSYSNDGINYSIYWNNIWKIIMLLCVMTQLYTLIHSPCILNETCRNTNHSPFVWEYVGVCVCVGMCVGMRVCVKAVCTMLRAIDKFVEIYTTGIKH